MILPILVAGILMLGILAATARGEDNNTGGGETQAPPAGAPQGATNNESRADFVNTILAIHNRERAAVGVPPLVWSDTLAANAKPWAEHVAQINQMVHSTGAERPGQVSQGENIASTGYQTCDMTGSCHGIHGVGQLTKMVESWVAEKKNFHGGEQVGGSNLYQVGHYTQVVWRDTKQVGCGMATASNGVNDYLVCRYSPPGNQFGHPPY